MAFKFRDAAAAAHACLKTRACRHVSRRAHLPFGAAASRLLHSQHMSDCAVGHVTGHAVAEDRPLPKHRFKELTSSCAHMPRDSPTAHGLP